jgi:hypothetical protein
LGAVEASGVLEHGEDVVARAFGAVVPLFE